MPWLDWGYERVIATDAVFSSLARLRERLVADHPEWLERILLVESDMRTLPLKANSVETAFAIESLYYLNEDYHLGLAECRRILKQTGRLLIAERSWEGAVLTRLLYGGVEEMLGALGFTGHVGWPRRRPGSQPMFHRRRVNCDLTNARIDAGGTQGSAVWSHSS